MPSMQTFVVYRLVHVPTGHFYIGSSSCWERRQARHRAELKSGRHHNEKIQNLLSGGYVSADWVFSVLSKQPGERSMRSEEGRLLKLYREDALFLNVGQTASGGDTMTRHPRREVIVTQRKERQRAEIEGMTTEERRARWARNGSENPMFGRTHTEAAKAAVSAANKGHSRNKGTVRSTATRSNISAAASLRTGSRNAFFGKQHSAETKAKLSSAAVGRTPKNARPVFADGNAYESVAAAARALGVSSALVVYRLKSPKWAYSYGPNECKQ